MKKIIILFSILFIFCLNIFAKNIPLYLNSINMEGIGIIKLPQQFVVYEKPNTNSKKIIEFKWGKAAGPMITDSDFSDNFIIMDEDKNLAYMTVISDSDNADWYEICYDQKKKLTGWVKPSNYEFYSWVQFYNIYGKANGVYFFRNLPNNEKKLYSRPDLDSQSRQTFDLVKDARVQIFRGNWVLLRVYDYDGNMKMGWFKWRTDEGKFKLFPRVK